MSPRRSRSAVAAARLSRLLALAAAVLLSVSVSRADGDRHPPSDGAKDMPGALGTFDFNPSDSTGVGTTSWWLDSEGVDPGTAGCHLGVTEDGKPNGRMCGEACTEAGLLVESNPGTEVLHKHTDDTGHPDLFDCNAWCVGKGEARGACAAAEAPPCKASARCACEAAATAGH